MDREWIGNARRGKPDPCGMAISSGREVRTASRRVRDSTSSYVGFWELDRGGRTVGERLRVSWPSAGSDGFGVALEQRGGAVIGAEGNGSGNDRERRTATALFETREASQRMMRVVLGPHTACRACRVSVMVTGVFSGSYR